MQTDRSARPCTTMAALLKGFKFVLRLGVTCRLVVILSLSALYTLLSIEHKGHS